MSMTAPVTTTMNAADGSKSEMCFYIPKKNQKNVPWPSNQQVSLLDRQLTILTRFFDVSYWNRDW